MKLVIFYLTNKDRHFTFPHYVKFLNESQKKTDWEIIILTHDNDADFYKSVLAGTDINNKIIKFPEGNNYLLKANFALQYAKSNSIPYMMKCDNDLFFRGRTLDYMIDNLHLLDDDSNLTLGPCLSSGIPSIEYFIPDYLSADEKKTLEGKFLETQLQDIWGARFSHHNAFTTAAAEWDGHGFFADVSKNTHAYKGIHPVRVNVDAINYLNDCIIGNPQPFYNDRELSIIRDDKSPYLCNSVYCIKTSNYDKILNDQSLYIDCFDEVPLNKYAWRTSSAHLIVRHGYGIHMHYNTIPGNLERERLFCEKFF
jgi:hypothetical protein